MTETAKLEALARYLDRLCAESARNYQAWLVRKYQEIAR